MPNNSLTYKIASESWEFDQIHSLNYRTFVEEIPQHASNAEQRLVDKFHEENTYYICLKGQRLAGMIAARANRPFSLDEKVADLDSYLPAGESFCEMRLLALEPEFRHSHICADLFLFAAKECLQRGYTLAVASGTLRQQQLYSSMGFVPFAHPVGTEQARYQPMYLTLQSVLELFKRLGAPEPGSLSRLVSFLPGPVEIDARVQEAFRAAPLSHRSDEFLSMVAGIKQLLCDQTRAAGVELPLGSGTLGNEVVTAQHKLVEGHGDIQRWRVADVVAVGLERRPEYGDPLARDITVEQLGAAAQEPVPGGQGPSPPQRPAPGGNRPPGGGGGVWDHVSHPGGCRAGGGGCAPLPARPEPRPVPRAARAALGRVAPALGGGGG